MEIVMATIAVVRRGDRVLMLRRREDDRSYPGMWCLPGGRVDSGESPAEAVEREVFEETGLRVEVAKVLMERDSPLSARARIYRISAFEAIERAAGGELIAFPSEEHVEAAWVDPGAALRELELAGPVTRDLLTALADASLSS